MSAARKTDVVRRGPEQAHKALVRRLVEEGCAAGNLAILDEAFAPASPVVVRLTSLLEQIRVAIPEARWTIEEQVAEGDTVVTRLCVEGVQRGPLLGIPATGRAAALSGVVFSRFANGRIAGGWAQADLLGLLHRLGVMPELEVHSAVAVARMSRAGAMLTADDTATRLEDGGRAEGSRRRRDAQHG